jgi:hypothetical protein
VCYKLIADDSSTHVFLIRRTIAQLCFMVLLICLITYIVYPYQRQFFVEPFESCISTPWIWKESSLLSQRDNKPKLLYDAFRTPVTYQCGCLYVLFCYFRLKPRQFTIISTRGKRSTGRDQLSKRSILYRRRKDSKVSTSNNNGKAAMTLTGGVLPLTYPLSEDPRILRRPPSQSILKHQNIHVSPDLVTSNHTGAAALVTSST